MTDSVDSHWERRVAQLWETIDDHAPDRFVELMECLTHELPPAHPVATFELAGVFDSTGHSDRAIPLYRKALDDGLTGERRRRATIQMASSLRNLGHAQESVALLLAERERTSDQLDDAVVAFLALALVDIGREREAASIALLALAPHLLRYQRSVRNYSRSLVEPDENRS